MTHGSARISRPEQTHTDQSKPASSQHPSAAALLREQDATIARQTAAHDDIKAAELNAAADRVAELIAKRQALKKELHKKNAKELKPDAKKVKESELNQLEYELEKLLSQADVLKKLIEFKLELPPRTQGTLKKVLGALGYGISSVFHGLAGIQTPTVSRSSSLEEQYDAFQKALAEPTSNLKTLEDFRKLLSGFLEEENDEKLPQKEIRKQIELLRAKLNLVKEAEAINIRRENLERGIAPASDEVASARRILQEQAALIDKKLSSEKDLSLEQKNDLEKLSIQLTEKLDTETNINAMLELAKMVPEIVRITLSKTLAWETAKTKLEELDFYQSQIFIRRLRDQFKDPLWSDLNRLTNAMDEAQGTIKLKDLVENQPILKSILERIKTSVKSLFGQEDIGALARKIFATEDVQNKISNLLQAEHIDHDLDEQLRTAAKMEKGSIENLKYFRTIRFAENPFRKSFELVESSHGTIERLREGKLRDKPADRITLEGNDYSFAATFGEETRQNLLKIESDRIDLKKSLREMKSTQKQLDDAMEGLEALHAEHGRSKEELANLDRTKSILFARSEALPKEIDTLERAINLTERMKKTSVLRAAIERKRQLAAHINTLTAELKILEAAQEKPSIMASDLNKTSLGSESVHLSPIELKSKVAELIAKIKPQLDEANQLKQKVDLIFEQELMRLQDLDADPIRGRLPIDYWTPWLMDIARDATGFGEDSRRIGTEKVSYLTRQKLMADQGVSLGEAYDALAKSLENLAKLGSDEQKKQLIRMVRVPKWIIENPDLANEMIGQFKYLLLELYGTSTSGQIIEYINSREWVKDVLATNSEADKEEMSPEGFALLDLTARLPMIIGAYKKANERDNTFLGDLGSKLPGFFGDIGKTIGNSISGAIGSIVTQAIAQSGAEAFPGAGKILQAIISLRDGREPIEVGKELIQRGVLAEMSQFGRNMTKLGFLGALNEIRANFNTWWEKSKPAEKAFRIFTQYIVPAASITVGILGIVGSIALQATGFGAPLGWIIGGLTAPFVMRIINEHILFRGTTETVNMEAHKRQRERRRVPDAQYANRIQTIAPPVASGGEKKQQMAIAGSTSAPAIPDNISAYIAANRKQEQYLRTLLTDAQARTKYLMRPSAAAEGSDEERFNDYLRSLNK